MGVLLFSLVGYTVVYFIAAGISRFLVGGEWANTKIYSTIWALLLPPLIISQFYFLLIVTGLIWEPGPSDGLGILALMFMAPAFWALALLLMVLLRVRPAKPWASGTRYLFPLPLLIWGGATFLFDPNKSVTYSTTVVNQFGEPVPNAEVHFSVSRKSTYPFRVPRIVQTELPWHNSHRKEEVRTTGFDGAIRIGIKASSVGLVNVVAPNHFFPFTNTPPALVNGRPIPLWEINPGESLRTIHHEASLDTNRMSVTIDLTAAPKLSTQSPLADLTITSEGVPSHSKKPFKNWQLSFRFANGTVLILDNPATRTNELKMNGECTGWACRTNKWISLNFRNGQLRGIIQLGVIIKPESGIHLHINGLITTPKGN